MNRSDLIVEIAMKLNHLKCKKVETGVRAILELLSYTLEEGGRIEIRGFGSFNIHHTNAKTARNPKTNEPVYVEAKRVPHFKPGKELRKRVNGGQYVKVRY